jgi:hypothetical protein
MGKDSIKMNGTGRQSNAKEKIGKACTPNMTVLFVVFLLFVILPFDVPTSYSWCVT